MIQWTPRGREYVATYKGVTWTVVVERFEKYYKFFAHDGEKFHELPSSGGIFLALDCAESLAMYGEFEVVKVVDLAN